MNMIKDNNEKITDEQTDMPYQLRIFGLNCYWLIL